MSLEENLDRVLARLSHTYRDQLAVVEDGRFLGAVRMTDVLARYHKEVFKHEMAAGVASGLDDPSAETVVRQVGGYVVAEFEAPARFWGKTLADLAIPTRYGLNVLLIKRVTEDGSQEPTMASPQIELRAGDRMVVFGLPDALERLRSETD